MNSVKGQVVDIINRTIYPAEVVIDGGIITQINPLLSAPMVYIMPGFVDAHIHIESSMLVPYEFAKLALVHGTVATVSDPHEIANVLGVEGVHYMIENARDAQLKFHFGAPSCVPATSFESAGATIDSKGVKELLESEDIYYLSEMMNYPGVLSKDQEVLKKIAYAKELNKPIDGHAPGLIGELARAYIEAGISTDHECYTLKEAKDKLSFGMKILIREGSAAKNFDALHPVIKSHPDRIMFCSDDKHPDDLELGHINLLVKRALKEGYDLFDVLQIACVNPVEHYSLRSGLLRVDDPGDFILIEDLKDFKILKTYINGVCVMDDGSTILSDKSHKVVNQFNIKPLSIADFKLPANVSNIYPTITAIDGELITEKAMTHIMPTSDGYVYPDIAEDILKIAVINRYQESKPAIGFIKNFGLKSGAIASTVAHDSHNIIVVGCTDEDISNAVNELIVTKGGLCAVNGNQSEVLPLPIAGLMSDQSGLTISTQYQHLNKMVQAMGCTLNAPFMTLSFMALLVIPKIKISDKGMFDAESFKFY